MPFALQPTAVEKYMSRFGGYVVNDPMTLTAVSMGATAVGGAASAAGTLAGGSMAARAGQMQQQEADYQAAQLNQNATQAIASGQRQMMDTQQRTRLAMSSSTAQAAGSGVNAGVGSPATNVGQLAARGSYQALMDMFNGQSKATGLENEAAGDIYSGQAAEIGGAMQKSASYLTAGGTLAGTVGSMAGEYGLAKYPALYGRPVYG